jgi:hypothetical protein
VSLALSKTHSNRALFAVTATKGHISWEGLLGHTTAPCINDPDNVEVKTDKLSKVIT